MKRKAEASAPGKLMLFGEHAVVYGRPCIVTAVNQKVTVTAATNGHKFLSVNAPNLGLRGYEKALGSLGKGDVPKSAKFAEFAVRNFFRRYKIQIGVDITTASDFSSEFGFGSSSAVTVAIMTALSKLFDIDLDNELLFDMCYKTVLDVQGVGSGFDLAAAIWGGTLYFDGKTKKVTPFKIKNLPLVVGYTGVKADTATLVRQVADLRAAHPDQVSKIFSLITDIVEAARESIKKGDFKTAGKLADFNQGLLNSLGVSTKELEDLIFAARNAGAYGAKLSGAGGGDCMIAFVSDRTRIGVERAIARAGGKVLHVKSNS